MKRDGWFLVGVLGAVLACVACLTPLAVIALGAIGPGVWADRVDLVAVPVLAVAIGLAALRYRAARRGAL